MLLGLLGLALGLAPLSSRWAFRQVSYTGTLSNPPALLGDTIT